MNLTPTALLEHAKSEAGRRAIRYSMTSAIGVAGTQVFLAVFQFLGWQPVVANLVAVTLMSVPAFVLNKRWVWGKRGKAHMRREVVPFWLFTVAGWILSTIAVAKVPSGNKLAVQAANIAGFAVLWVLKYLFLDKIMFGPHHHTPYDEDIEREEQGHPAALEPAEVDRRP
ncbi:MAG: GtrA family protein [Actinobacteria bacterium]|nr:GtrA family protein [Actinomycetota bacterium]